MASHISILKFVNNPLSDESIAIGLIAITNGKVFFRLSPTKLDFAKKLNPSSIKLLDFSINQLKHFAYQDSVDNSNKLITIENQLSVDFIDRLSNYNNGIVQFSKPSFIKSEINTELFNQYFEKFIGKEKEKIDTIHIREESPLQIHVEKKLYEPLHNQVDVDFTLKKKQLPSLFFDFHFDIIGVNGAMYAAKAVDFNSGKAIHTIKNDIIEYESIIERLNIFAKQKQINGEAQYYLIADSYNGTTLSYMDLYSVLEEGNMPLFQLISSNDLDKIVREVKKNKARKFSEEL